MDIDKEMIKGYIESIILCLLKNEELYGYEISKIVRSMSKDTFEIKEGTLYVVLKRLENNNLVLSYWGDNKSGGGRRRYYKITDEGINYLIRKKEEWIFFKNIIDTFFRGV
ncbi:PadR family transcriptional regulator [Clostridium sporogenes]|uniref:PadR family transcriptional regulator n=1 Tax=Clostridium sporogenes TaxID=1509 RepID=UPI0013D87213|nr:PadR family transcriptional regulator [Clostridium sporogenes]EJE7234543.1 PadR family transcriptional regulator [Clostridium botulinum]NFE81564.1 PadR family transcriptional regulator [Clostridium sporogenes]NFG69599.1 PadR family transcriptional regulator [Clostridium sporogenes]